jgi:TPP-dependent pyruvate/acetoin dehydrogenase alpha subunit
VLAPERERGSTIALFREVLRIRLIEETIADRYSEQEMRCPVHLSIGQEAVAAGVCATLETADLVISTHRAHAHYLAKGGDVPAMVAEIYGKHAGCSGGRGGSMHLVDLERGFAGSTPIVGSSLPLAVGLAFAASLRRQTHVVAAFFGEGMTEEGVFLEALNFAALRSLPIVFVCENNLYSVYSPLDVRQPANRDRCAVARAHGIEAIHVDGNDAAAVVAAAREAVDRARRGRGPTYLECDTYRWREHCGPNYDNDIGYRTEAEFLSWKAKDPLERLRAQLRGDGLLSADDEARMTAEIREEIDAAFAFAKAAASPPPEDVMNGIYA